MIERITIVEPQNLPELFADSAVAIDCGEVVRLIFLARRWASDEVGAKHFATARLVLPRAAFLGTLSEFNGLIRTGGDNH